MTRALSFLLVVALFFSFAAYTQTPGAQPEICVTSPSQTVDYNLVCMSASSTGGTVGVTNFGNATGGLTINGTNSVLYATNYSGTTAGDKISACVADLPSTGGTCDARGLPSGGTIPTITLAKNGATLLLPCGVFNVSGPIILWNNGGTLSGFNLVGCGASFDFAVGTQLNWTGGSTVPLLDLRGVRDSTFSSFSIKSDLTAPLAECIRLETWPGAVSTRRRFSNITCFSVRATGLIKGFRWCTGFDCSNGTVVGNNDLDFLSDVIVSNYDNCAYSIEGTQSKTHMFLNSTFAGQSQSQRGICTTQGADASTNAGSFRWYGAAGGGNNQIADFDLGAPTDNIFISGCNFEGSKRLLQTVSAGSAIWGITIEGCRWTSNNINADGKAVIYKLRGALTISSMQIENGGSLVAPTFSIESSGVPIVGNAFGNAIQSSGATAATNPFICATLPSSLCWSVMGNIVNDTATGNNFIVPNAFVSNPLTVANLPACTANTKGNSQFVTDQNTAVAYHGAVTGGGTPGTSQRVTCDGSAYYQD